MMALNKILTWTKSLEDPKNPVLGPTLKGLYYFGLWRTESKVRTITYKFVHFISMLFVVTEYIDLYTVRHDINKVFSNLSQAGLGTACIAKRYSYLFWHQYWKELMEMVSEEELLQIQRKDPIAEKHRKDYTMYSRFVTYLYWILVFMTNLVVILAPLMKYVSSKAYRLDVKAGVQPYPQIYCAWFPFDKNTMPGYLGALIFHILISCQGSGLLGVYDMNAIVILCYLKGQMKILKEKCEHIFDDVTSTQDVLDRIRECHRHHNVLFKQYHLFDSLVSPPLFLYVLLCSVTICCSVVQFSSNEGTTSQKFWVVQFTTALVSQLFLYCWHTNEVTIESKEVDGGIYASEWWRGGVYERRQLLLLAGKLTQPFIFNAGPYTTLSVPTFIDIMKGSYSFYTLFSRMQD